MYWPMQGGIKGNPYTLSAGRVVKRPAELWFIYIFFSLSLFLFFSFFYPLSLAARFFIFYFLSIFHFLFEPEKKITRQWIFASSENCLPERDSRTASRVMALAQRAFEYYKNSQNIIDIPTNLPSEFYEGVQGLGYSKILLNWNEIDLGIRNLSKF